MSKRELPWRPLTRIFGILWADVFVARIQNVFVHQGRTWRNLSEERDFDRLANLDPLTFLYENLSCVFAPVFAIQTRHTVLFWVMAFFERLKRSHQIMTTGDTGGDNALCDASCDSAFDYGSDRVHGTDNLCLELRWHM